MRVSPFNPYIALTIGVIAISSTAIFVKMTHAAPASIIAVYRLFFAVILLAPIVIVSSPHVFKNIHFRQWGLFAGAGFCVALYVLLSFEALRLTSVANAVVLLSLQPLFVFIASSFFVSGRFSARAIISMFITLIGSFVIIWSDVQLSRTALFGDLFALLSALFGASYFLFSQQGRKKIEFVPYTFIVYSIGTLILVVYNVIIQAPFSPYSSMNWSLFFAVAIIPTFLGHAIFHWALKWVHISTIRVAIVCEPVGAIFLAYLVLHEQISWQQWLGGSIVLIGLLLFIVSTTRKNRVTLSNQSNL